MADAGAQIYRYFRGRGLSPHAAAGLVGNAQQESSLNPNAPGGGLFQYIGSRAGSGHGNLQQQLDATWRELTGPERNTLNALKGAKSAQEAARIFSERFERPGVPMLSNRERYAAEALRRYGALSGEPAQSPAQRPSGGAEGQETASGGEGAAPVNLQVLQSLLEPKAPAPVVQVGRPTEPKSFATPKVAQAAPQAEPQSAKLASLLATIGTEPTAEGGSEEAGGEQGAAHEVAGEHPGHYVNPVPGFAKGRTDQGVDYSAKPGAEIRAIGNAKVLGVSPNWYKGQPYVYYELQDGPAKGKVVFVAEQITPEVHAGQTVRAGQRIGRYASSGTGIETGYGTRVGGQTLAKATTGHREGEQTPAGQRFRSLLERLGAR